MFRLGLASFFATMLACGVAAAQTDMKDVARLCEAHVYGATVQQYDVATRAYARKAASMMCSDSEFNKEKAKAKSLNGAIEYNGIKLSSLFSDNDSERMNARQKICTEDFSDVKDQTAVESFGQYADPSFHTHYNECIRLALSQDELSCSITPGAEPDQAVLTILYTKRFDHADPTITVAEVQGGTLANRSQWKSPGVGGNHPVMVPGDWLGSDSVVVRGYVAPGDVGQDLSGTPARLDIADTVLKPGGRVYPLIRANAQSAISVTVNSDIGLKCNRDLGPISPVKITTRIRPIGKKIISTTSSRDEEIVGGCTVDHHDTRRICIASNENIVSFDHVVTSSNCPRNESKVKDVRKVSENCVDVDYHLKGCGRSWYGNCKGRGWLNYTLRFKSQSAGPGIDVPSEVQGVDGVAFNSRTFTYAAAIPDDVDVDSWDYTVDLEYKAKEGGSWVTKRSTLNSSNLSEEAYSIIPESSEKGFRVTVKARAAERASTSGNPLPRGYVDTSDLRAAFMEKMKQNTTPSREFVVSPSGSVQGNDVLRNPELGRPSLDGDGVLDRQSIEGLRNQTIRQQGE